MVASSSLQASPRGPGNFFGLRSRQALALAVAGAVALLTPPISANHAQTSGNVTVTFDHDGDNEWWVEVLSKASAGDSVVAMEVRPESGTFRGLQQKAVVDGWTKWGPEQAFRIPAGERVQFRAHVLDGGTSSVTLVDSCLFTHPAGVEQCGSAPPPPPPPPGGFDATFTGVRGNEWWVQANVATNGPPITRVDVTLDGGKTFRPLAKQSWGATAWAASYHIPQGTIVQLRATASTGQVDLSSCRQWIPASGQDARIVPCGGSPPPAQFDASFTGVKGNEWWVQVTVTANQAVAGVAVRVDCGVDWQPLVKQSWGGWAASFHIPAGSKLDFQARNATFASDASGGYIWPQATPATGCPQGNWPRQGSHVTYSLSGVSCGGGDCETSEATLRLLYENGRWMGTCQGHDTFRGGDGTETTEDWTSDHAGLPPSHEDPTTTIGAVHRPDMFHTSYHFNHCSMGWVNSPVTVMRQEDHETSMRDASGNPITLRAWYAESTNPDDNLYTAHWDTKVGLVLDVDSYPRRSGHGSAHMRLVATDAPLR